MNNNKIDIYFYILMQTTYVGLCLGAIHQFLKEYNMLWISNIMLFLFAMFVTYKNFGEKKEKKNE